MSPETFTLTQDHITLLGSAYISWDDTEYGAPRIDPKRPYGNSNVEHDICDLLGWQLDKREEAAQIHQETQTALQVILDTKSFVPGVYERERYGGKWKLVS